MLLILIFSGVSSFSGIFAFTSKFDEYLFNEHHVFAHKDHSRILSLFDVMCKNV